MRYVGMSLDRSAERCKATACMVGLTARIRSDFMRTGTVRLKMVAIRTIVLYEVTVGAVPCSGSSGRLRYCSTAWSRVGCSSNRGATFMATIESVSSISTIFFILFTPLRKCAAGL